MKKIFTLMMAAAATLTAAATDYNEKMVITVNGEASEQTAVVTVNNNGETYDLTLKNFILQSEDGPMGVGNVEIKNMKPQMSGNSVILTTNETVTITEGDDPTVPFWMATLLPPVPVELQGVIENGHVCASIHIDLQDVMQQIIDVTVGTGYQFSNQSFETWHTSSGNYEEPDTWHSFESASGMLASLAGHHISRSDDAHSGKASARIFSTSIFGIIANGTMTTGRMNAGSMVASDKANNAYTDMSNSDVDGNGDPFYTPLVTRPDSIVFWYKFKQGKVNDSHPYASVSTVITDGTYYQDPEDKEYTNVVARANSSTVAPADQWTRMSLPFSYTEANIDPRAIMVTISTNADAGQGSNGDEMLVDDIELVYNARLSTLKIEGQEVTGFDPEQLEYKATVKNELKDDDIEVTTDGHSTHVVKDIQQTDHGYLCTITTYNANMTKSYTYHVDVESTMLTAVRTINGSTQAQAAYYTIDGRRANTPAKGKVYIVRKADGTVTKVVR